MISASIYFIATADRSLIKIGISKSPLNRLGGLLAWSPVPLTLLTTVPGTYQDERALHHHFRDSWHHFEWFCTSDALLTIIDDIAAEQKIPALNAPPNRWRLPHQKVPGPQNPEQRKLLIRNAQIARANRCARRRAEQRSAV